MWAISYLNKDDEARLKRGFKTDKEALDWAYQQEQDGNITALKLLVWSDYLNGHWNVMNI